MMRECIYEAHDKQCTVRDTYIRRCHTKNNNRNMYMLNWRIQQSELHLTMKSYTLVTVVTLLWVMNVGMVKGQWSPCENMCGKTPVIYPFGTAPGCGGVKEIEEYVKCDKEKGKMVLSTETGEYNVEKIDYSDRVMLVHDPAMSTCAAMLPRSSSSRKWWFELPAGSPFTVDARNTFLLLGCSNYSHSNDDTCDDSGNPICKSIFSSCSSIANLGFAPSSYTNSCCLYDSSNLQDSPSQLNLPLLHCSSYMGIYSYDPDQSSSSSGSVYQDPLSWSYGILLNFYYDDIDVDGSQYNSSSCARCQETNGVCSYNKNGFICVCPGSLNVSTRCSDYYDMAAASQEANHKVIPAIGLFGLLGFLLWL